jgi:hypothetical protein
LAVVVFRVELAAAEVAFAVFSSSVAGTNASCTRTSSPWPTCSTKKIALLRTRYQHFVANSFAPRRASGATFTRTRCCSTVVLTVNPVVLQRNSTVRRLAM